MTDPKQIVADGYDATAERHAEWARHTRANEREHYTALIEELVPPDAAVLELGCGTGVPTTQRLARRYRVTGVDISPRHIALAQKQVPEAQFELADMAALSFPPASFDAVVSFYALIHLPRDEQPALLGRIASWLRPGGVFVATMTAGAMEGDVDENWHGAPMYWSGFDSSTNQRLVRAAGLVIEQAREETADEDGEPITFLWVVARKPIADTMQEATT